MYFRISYTSNLKTPAQAPRKNSQSANRYHLQTHVRGTIYRSNTNRATHANITPITITIPRERHGASILPFRVTPRKRK